MLDIAIFAVTQRTGSTLLQRIFNASPTNLVWGEGGRALELFLRLEEDGGRFSREMAGAREKFFAHPRPIDIDTSCMSPVESEFHSAVIKAVRAYLTRLYSAAPSMRVGFKEVLHSPAAVRLFREAFPGATIVLLARHPVSAWHSLPPDWNMDLDAFIRVWRQNVQGYSALGKLFWFEDLISDPSTQTEIASLARVSDAQLAAVLAARVNSSARFSTRTQAELDRILVECADLIPERVSQFVARKRRAEAAE